MRRCVTVCVCVCVDVAVANQPLAFSFIGRWAALCQSDRWAAPHPASVLLHVPMATRALYACLRQRTYASTCFLANAPTDKTRQPR